MTRAIIEVENISKLYRLGQFNARTLREEVERLFRRRRGNGKANGLLDNSADTSEFWALKDVSFSVQPGDVVGIIGRNGAGKSTLLKILSRVTEPTSGQIGIRGRVASLLEVGTGFHPELTGRENIFLNGAILGMSRAEIRCKFEEIVDFAEIEKFLDTPVKRYSSGMYVRLAFAVAAHLEPEILIVDEVLAVGDVSFQNKCLGKMETIRQGGRTVLVVSHNMPVIRRLCTRAILFSEGRLKCDDSPDVSIDRYLTEAQLYNVTAESVEKVVREFPPDPNCRLIRVALLQDAKFTTQVESGKPLEILFDYEIFKETYGFHAYFQLADTEGNVLFESIDSSEDREIPSVKPGRYRSVATIPANFLAPRRYELSLGIAIAYKRYCIPKPVRIGFEVQLTGPINQAFPGYSTPGKLLPSLRWRSENVHRLAT